MKSNKQSNAIQDNERLIFALDVPRADQALELVKMLKSEVRIFKVGTELFSGGGDNIIDRIAGEGARIFLDLKLLDIPRTVNKTIQAIKTRHEMVVFTTIHNFNRGFQKPEGEGNLKILAVSLLTSMSQDDLRALGISISVEEYVMNSVRLARESGCDGVIASGKEVARIKREFGPDFLVITPAIRPFWAGLENEDQKRIVTPREAIINGADYLVVGRPIRENADPLEAARKIQAEIKSALEEK